MNPGDLVYLRGEVDSFDVLFGDSPDDDGVLVGFTDPMLIIGNYIHEKHWPPHISNLLVLVHRRLVYIMSDMVVVPEPVRDEERGVGSGT